MFNVKKEAYVSGRGSMATEFLPDDIREDKVKEGTIIVLAFPNALV